MLECLAARRASVRDYELLECTEVLAARLMLTVRLYDRDSIEPFEWDGIDTTKDAIVVAELNETIEGVVACRMVPLIHGFQVRPGMLAGKTAEGLWRYMNGYARGSGLNDALMVVKDDKVRHFVEGRGLVNVDRNVDLYTIAVR